MGTWKYNIVHDYNATRLLKEFQEENLKLKHSKGAGDDEVDFIIYAEKDDLTINLGRVLLIKMSDALIKYFFQYKGKEDLTKVWAEHIYNEQKLKESKTFQFTVDDLSKAFLVSISTQSKLLFDISVLDAENFLKRITDNLSDFLHEDLKFSREQWDPTLGSDKYLFAKPESAVNYFVKKCDNLTNELKNIKDRLELFKSFHFFDYELKTPIIGDLIDTIDKLIKNIQKFKAWIIENKNDIQLKIPYICGVWNGMVEFLAGIVDIILLALRIIIDELFDDKLNLELLELRESIEEILSAIIKDPGKIFNEAIEAVKNYKYSRYDDPKLNKYQLQYNEGEDTILAIDLVVTIVTIIKGLAALTRKLPKFTKWIDDVLKRNGKGARKLENALIRLTKVTYGDSEFSKLAIKFRKTLPKPKHDGNIAIFEYVDDAGNPVKQHFTSIPGNKDHAEMIGMKWLKQNGIADEKVVKIYSELEPCSLEGHNCKQRLQRYKNAEIEYSYDYPGNQSSGFEIRRSSIKERKNDLVKFVK
ncbi:MAG: hypothetical protein POELPBGB_01339 [Bacteroidia bacterium]|nr:hypothetical protein [Bacteroidia bacterium]